MNNKLSTLDQEFSVGIYIRLSKDDGNIGNSESVENQKKLLTNYISEKKYNLYNIYIDDGYTGTNFDRPSFKKMLNDIKLKKINMVITKDLSRLSRDYIGTGEYIEKWFPENNVRFIALSDNIDTFIDSCNNDIAPFKALLNDMYARDLSKKIKTALRTKQKDGKWVGGCTPYGYITTPDNKNQLVVHEKEGYVVKKIFKMYYTGKNINEIKNFLNKENIPTFSISRNRNLKKLEGQNKLVKQWEYSSIKKILNNRLYTGDLIQNRRNRISYKYRKIIKNNEDKWIIVENTHEALIEKEIFLKVQKLLKKNKPRSNKKEIYLLDGLLKCGNCGCNIGISARNKKNKCYTVCNNYRKNYKKKICTSHNNDYDNLEKQVLSKLLKIINKLDQEYIYENVKKNYKNSEIINNIQSKIEDLTFSIKKNNELIEKLYIEKLEEKIKEEFYNNILKKINKDKNEDIKKLENLKKEEKKFLKNNQNNIKDKIKNFLKLNHPTRDLVLKLIKNIYIYEDKKIEIYYNFKN